tara:strand:+ start:7657 stop:8289 length:633 start_codon:yes stop_codon:yes gene_type:complete
MNIAGKAMEWFNRGLNKSIPNEAKASWGDLISNDIKQRGKFGKGGSLGGWDLTRGFRPGVPASEGGFMSGPTPLGREIIKRPLRALANLSPVGRLAGGLPGLVVGDLISPQPLAAGTLDEAIARGDVPKEDYDKLQEKYQKEYDDYMNPKGTDPLAPPIKLARANTANPHSTFIRDPGGSGKLIKFNFPLDLRSVEQKMQGHPFNQMRMF